MAFQEGGIGVGFHPNFLQGKPQANNLTVPFKAHIAPFSSRSILRYPKASIRPQNMTMSHNTIESPPLIVANLDADRDR
jgi:hypothetical protein